MSFLPTPSVGEGSGVCTIRKGVGAWSARAFERKAMKGTPEEEAEETSTEAHGETCEQSWEPACGGQVRTCLPQGSHAKQAQEQGLGH